MIGISGAHRTGKSAIAKTWAERNKAVYVKTTATEVFKRLGYDTACTTYDFSTRLTIQEAILDEFEAIYAKHSFDETAIADRTPLDLMSYTIAEAIGGRVSASECVRLEKYLQRCFDVTNKYFSALLIVQPGIPVVEDEGKGFLNTAYMEHLNTILLGLSVDLRLTTAHYFIPRGTLELEDRLKSVDFVTNKVRQNAQLAVAEAMKEGARFH